MTVDDKNIRNEKLKYYIKRKAAKPSALSSGKIDKYAYLRGENILPPIKVDWTSEKRQKNIQKQVKIKDENKQMLSRIKTKEKGV